MVDRNDEYDANGDIRRTPAAGDQTARGPVVEEQQGRRGISIPGLILVLLILLLVVVFIVENSHNVTVHYFGWDGTVSLALALLGTFVGGILIAGIPAALRIAQLRHRVRKLR